MMKRFVVATAFLIAAAAPAAAYTTYVLPEQFGPEGNQLSLQASFASQFFTPGVAVAADFDVVRPDGGPGTFSRVEVAGQATTMHADLPAFGTYRITSGERMGRVSTLVGIDGGWRELRDGETAPEDAQVTTLQTVTVSEVYVSRGEPTRGVLESTVGTLAIRPVTHPNQVLVGQPMEVDVVFQGAPFANTALVIYREGDADTDVDTFVATDAQGRARITFDAPGNYVLAARHRAPAPEGSEAQVRSYTTTLTFNVLTALPDYPEPPQQDRPRRPRRDVGFGR